ncbi:MAG: phosphoribosylanthranilate isomerase [Hyphomonadaceae bacterium]|nr:phosphoribosylanthranilate isomerase [Hyphomonadaceae bacterium]
MAEAKICGVKDAPALDAAIAGGARYIGLIFFPKSPRHVTFEAAQALAARARGRAQIVAVTVDADDAALAAIQAAAAPDWLQLHGAEPPPRVAAARRFARNGTIKALPVATRADLTAADAYAGAADMLLFDAKPPPGAGLPGGNGAAFDWPILAGRRLPRPWFLSGGLTADNVREAIAAAGATQVDTSSGVESAPGVKDLERIAAFLAAARQPPA